MESQGFEGFGKVVAIRVSSFGDLVRLVSSAAHMMVVMPVYRFKFKGKIVYAVQTIYKDYYKLYGVPIVYYYSTDDDGLDPFKAKYILAKADESGEKIEVSDRTRLGWLSIPLVNLEDKPPFIPDSLDV